MRYEIVSRNEKQTIALGASIGARLKGGEVLLLESDLGGGKTTLTRGLVEGIGSNDEVSSPTFMISQVYGGGRAEVHHYDLYRLGEMGLAREQLQEVLERGDVVTIIEWPSLAENDLPVDRLIHIRLDLQKSGEDDRLVTINYSEKLAYAIDKKEFEEKR